MKLFCIDLSKFIKDELSLIVKQYNVPMDADELFRLKMSGYNKLYIDADTKKWFFYTLNNAKQDIKLADYLKNIIIDLKPISQRVIPTETKVVNKVPIVTLEPGELSDDEIVKEYDRILEKIHKLGIDSITIGEQKFLSNYSDYSD